MAEMDHRIEICLVCGGPVYIRTATDFRRHLVSHSSRELWAATWREVVRILRGRRAM